MNLQRLLATIVVLATATASPAVSQVTPVGSVDIAFNRFYDYAQMTEHLHRLAGEYPHLLSIESLGRSVGGREIWCLTLNNDETGGDREKPAMFIDGNIHGNEVQAAETVLYSIWYLVRNYGKIDAITELVDRCAFYFVPMENPDGRDAWFHTPATPHFLRGGIKPTDNDHDGLYDEDGYDDLDGDGHITEMWIADPLGRYKRDDKGRFFERVGRDDPPGGWTRLGSEGIDNDGDGSVNEDGIGGYDPNRNWPSDWQPEHVQFGAGDYPFSLPETRAVGLFMLDHPNIAGVQSYHNAGGMILRGPAAHYMNYPADDERVHREISDEGAKMLPFYESMITHEDLYTVHGGEKGWAYEGLGIIAFTNELWSNNRMFQTGESPSREETREFRDRLQFKEVYVPYHEVDHPTYGAILVGGTKKWASRVPPPWMLEEECHRNFAFTMFHADQMPHLEFGAIETREIEDGLFEVTVEVTNDRLIPSITSQARRHRIGARDRICASPPQGGQVLASGTVSSMTPWRSMDASSAPDPSCLFNAGGIPGKGHRFFRFLIEGEGTIQVEYWTQKGGSLTKEIEVPGLDPAPAPPPQGP